MLDSSIEVATIATEPAALPPRTMGRRKTDRSGRSIFFWLFGMFLDDRHKPSMSRIMLALWTILGWLMVVHELHLRLGQPSIQNAVWEAWWKTEGMLAFAVFGPGIASYFGPGATGAIASGIGASVRDVVAKVETQVKGEPHV